MNKVTINFDSSHFGPQDSQVFIALTGTPVFIKEQLSKIFMESVGNYGKPIQGIAYYGKGVRQVITPVWEKTKY